MKTTRIANRGVKIENENGELFIPFEDVSELAIELIHALSEERLEWREAAGG